VGWGRRRSKIKARSQDLQDAVDMVLVCIGGVGGKFVLRAHVIGWYAFIVHGWIGRPLVGLPTDSVFSWEVKELCLVVVIMAINIELPDCGNSRCVNS
jgi:hypothetical protein